MKQKKSQNCSFTREGASCNGVPQEDYSERQTRTFQIFAKRSHICDFKESVHRFFLQQIYEDRQRLLFDFSHGCLVNSDSLHG
jgi:hypothetical protein